MLVDCLAYAAERQTPGGGYRRLIDLINRSHERTGRKRVLRREAAVLFRSLRSAGVIEVTRSDVRVAEDLQHDFSLHHALSLYLVDAVYLLDPDDPEYALDVLSFVEAILEDPRALLQRQQDVAKKELLAQLKAQGVPYEERIERLGEVRHPQPNAAMIYESFRLFAERHPWVGTHTLRPKSIAREMWERYEDFPDFVRRYGAQRSEGLLLRYLGQVHNTLVQSVPEFSRDEELVDAIAYFRALLARVDSSLFEEWEGQHGAKRGAAPGAPATTHGVPPDLARDPRRLAARVRAEMHQFLRALAAADYEAAAVAVCGEDGEAWTAEQIRDSLTPFFTEYQTLRFDAEARRSHHTTIRDLGGRRFAVVQSIVDDRDDDLWAIEAEVDLRSGRDPAGSLLRLRRIGC
jgi:hypothetical protein